VPPHCAPPQKLKLLQVPAEHDPHEPPHPSEPQVFPVQLGVQVVTHLPAALHVPSAHVPQEPPHPSGPHVRPMQAGTHAASFPASTAPLVPELPELPDVPELPEEPLVPELPLVPEEPLGSGSVACSGPSLPGVVVPLSVVPPLVPELHATTDSDTARAAARNEKRRMVPCGTGRAPDPSPERRSRAEEDGLELALPIAAAPSCETSVASVRSPAGGWDEAPTAKVAYEDTTGRTRGARRASPMRGARDARRRRLRRRR
jgi:hypothetical protein